ncbi:hypothetical protein E2C01_001083 [Portunus trituberculatus]|uniref:Uncharacterized protein n=1 Tax=Portunus trituberculatus TaxID=210409 RepID=A0A5B7CJC6_PORTR|nr:hypothetical protein [Portunus trituberculatus]
MLSHSCIVLASSKCSDHQTQRQPPAVGPRALATQGRAGRLPLARDWSLASAYRTRNWAQRVQNKILVELKGRDTVGERNLFRRGTWVATWLPQTLAGLGSGRNAPRLDLGWPRSHRGAKPPTAPPRTPIGTLKKISFTLFRRGAQGKQAAGHTGQEVEGGGTRLRSPPSD